VRVPEGSADVIRQWMEMWSDNSKNRFVEDILVRGFGCPGWPFLHGRGRQGEGGKGEDARQPSRALPCT